MNYLPSSPRTGIVQPASQWSHAVPTYMPWAHQNNPAQFMRFQAGQMPITAHTVAPAVPVAPADSYVHPGDPCSSRAGPTVQGPPPYQAFPSPAGPVPYPSFPSTSYCTPRFKRKMACEPWEQIPAKQLVTERMLERLNGLSLQEPCTSGYVPPKPSVTPSTEEGIMAAENSYEFSNSKAPDDNATNSGNNLIFTDTLKDIQRSHLNTSSLEERLALNEVKKATMALVPWSPPLLSVEGKKFKDFVQPSEKTEEEDCEASMEM